MQSQIWNVKHKKPKLATWILEVLTNQKQMFTFFHKKKGPGDKDHQNSDPPVY